MEGTQKHFGKPGGRFQMRVVQAQLFLCILWFENVMKLLCVNIVYVIFLIFLLASVTYCAICLSFLAFMNITADLSVIDIDPILCGFVLNQQIVIESVVLSCVGQGCVL